jgi:hypothetical protein
MVQVKKNMSTRYKKKMSQVAYQIPLNFSTESDSKIAPIVVGAGVFIAKAAVGGAIGAAASWGATRVLDNRFPTRK